MYKFEYYPYWGDRKITEDSKVLIGIGDSFCAGRGACSIELWEKYNWDMDRMYSEGGPEVGKSNYENSWVNQLCKNHMPDWTPVNLGMSGKGNRFAIKELMVNPLLNLEKAKEKIVVFAVSGFERFDLVYDIVGEEHFVTQWPVYDGWSTNNRVGYSELSIDNGESIYNDKFVTFEFIVNIIELVNWCKLNNAKLLLISAFTPELNYNHFKKLLSENIQSNINEKKLDALLSLIPWRRIIRPNGFSCITDMLMDLEGWGDKMNGYGFRNMKIKTIGPNGYMTKCHHPSEKGHKLLAEIIYESILHYDEVQEIEIKNVMSHTPKPKPKTRPLI
jgi:hypothetical protein